MGEPAYKIEHDKGEIVVRLRRDGLKREDVSRFLDFLELESIRLKSELTDADAATWAAEIDRAVFDRHRSRV